MSLRFAIVVALASFWFASAHAREPALEEVFSAVARFVPSARLASPPTDPFRAFAGEFTSDPEVERRSGPLLSRDSLYLLPDGGYFFVRSGDILPPTIYDRGTWTYDGRLLRLASDASLPRKHAISGALLPLRVRVAGSERLFVFELSDYSALKKARGQDEFTFLIFARSRAKLISPAIATRLRARLMRQAWNPSFFL